MSIASTPSAYRDAGFIHKTELVGDKRLPVQEVTCDICGKVAQLRNNNFKHALPMEVLVRKFKRNGWTIRGSKRWCPECTALKRRSGGMVEVPLISSIAASAAPQLTSEPATALPEAVETFLSPEKPKVPRRGWEVGLAKAQAARTERKPVFRLDALFRLIKTHGRVNTDEVINALGMTRASASALLSEQNAAGSIRRVGVGYYEFNSNSKTRARVAFDARESAIDLLAVMGKQSIAEVAETIGSNYGNTAQMLSSLYKQGRTARLGDGIYGPAKQRQQAAVAVEASEPKAKAVRNIDAAMKARREGGGSRELAEALINNLGKATTTEVQESLGITRAAASIALSRLTKEGRIRHLSRGVYGAVPKPAQPLAEYLQQTIDTPKESNVPTVNDLKELGDATIKTMDKDTRKRIFRAVDDAWDDDDGRYTGNNTDEVLSRRLNVPRAWVTEIRKENFGDSGGNEAVDLLKVELDRHIESTTKQMDDAVKLAGAFETSLNTLKTMRKRLDAIEAAVVPQRLTGR